MLYMQRLGDDNYVKKSITKTDTLTSENIRDLLEDYVEIDNLANVPLKSHIRYFVKNNGNIKFRMGGYLFNKNGLPKYIVLSNGKKSWSVQTDNTTFFKKLSIEELKNEYETTIIELQNKITKLQNYILANGGSLPQ